MVGLPDGTAPRLGSAQWAQGRARAGALPKLRKTAMNNDQARGTLKGALGRVQQQAGKLIGSSGQQAKGLARQAEGRLQKAFGNVKEALANSRHS